MAGNLRSVWFGMAAVVALGGCADQQQELASGSNALAIQVVEELESGQQVDDLSGAKDDWHYFVLDVPAGADALILDKWGGSGDSDLYVRMGELPTAEEFDFAQGYSGNRETLDIAEPGAGEWYIGVRGYSDFSGANLWVAYDMFVPTQTIFSGQTEWDLSGTAGSWRFYRIRVTHGSRELELQTRSGWGDVNIYVKEGWEPSSAFYDERTIGGGSWKTLRLPDPESGTYYVGLRGGYSRGYDGIRFRAWAR